MGSYGPSSWQWDIYIHVLKFFCMGDLSLFSYLSIYLVSHLYHHRLTYLILWVMVQYYFVLLLKIFQMYSWRAPLVASCDLWHHCRGFLFLSFKALRYLSAFNWILIILWDRYYHLFSYRGKNWVLKRLGSFPKVT